MSYTYQAYDLTWQLPFPCPALSPASAEAVADVIVQEGHVPTDLAAPLAHGVKWQAELQRYLFKGGARSGRFLVEGGHAITLQRNTKAEDERLAFHFLDSILAAVLRQRGWLVLHANSAVTPIGAVAIAGESGAGKSTTLSALLQRGCQMLADDITVVRLSAAGRAEVLPGVPQLHLTEEAADRLGQDVTDLPRVQRGRWKATVPIQLATAPTPLQALYLLQQTSTPEVRFQTLTRLEKISALQECVYGPFLTQEHADQFTLFMAIAEHVHMARLERPNDRWSIAEIVEHILHE